MPLKPQVILRKWHRWAAVLIAVPFAVVLVTGVLLQLRKEVAWVQPPLKRGAGKTPTINFDQILAAAQSAPEAEVKTWDDIDRLDVRPDKGMLKVRCRNGWEVQVDTTSGSVLQVAYRRADLIAAIHDGSWFHPQAALWLFLPAALIVATMWGSGLYLLVLPWRVRWRKANS